MSLWMNLFMTPLLIVDGMEYETYKFNHRRYNLVICKVPFFIFYKHQDSILLFPILDLFYNSLVSLLFTFQRCLWVLLFICFRTVYWESKMFMKLQRGSFHIAMPDLAPHLKRSNAHLIWIPSRRSLSRIKEHALDLTRNFVLFFFFEILFLFMTFPRFVDVSPELLAQVTSSFTNVFWYGISFCSLKINMNECVENLNKPGYFSPSCCHYEKISETFHLECLKCPWRLYFLLKPEKVGLDKE